LVSISATGTEHIHHLKPPRRRRRRRRSQRKHINTERKPWSILLGEKKVCASSSSSLTRTASFLCRSSAHWFWWEVGAGELSLRGAVAEPLLVLLHHLQYALEHGHLAWDPQHAFLLEPELLLCFPQQRREGPVAEVLRGDHEPPHLLPDAHRQVSLRDVPGRVGEGEGPLQELDALATAAALRRHRQLLPLLQDLLEPHYLRDLVGLLGIHGSLRG
ncbi:unnamed protein product, partial [Musa acuminata subsp. burmannicoides]